VEVKRKAEPVVKSQSVRGGLTNESGVSLMTRAERAELLRMAVAKLDEAACVLSLAEEELLAKQAGELADLIDDIGSRVRV
jgi:hypothetical protein